MRRIGEGVTEATADAWIAAWEAQAAEDGLERGSAYWQSGLGMDRRAAAALSPTLSMPCVPLAAAHGNPRYRSGGRLPEKMTPFQSNEVGSSRSKRTADSPS